jgi:hypothetical protein
MQCSVTWHASMGGAINDSTSESSTLEKHAIMNLEFMIPNRWTPRLIHLLLICHFVSTSLYIPP